VFNLYKIKEKEDYTAERSLMNMNLSMRYKELSITDKLKSQLEANNVDVEMKIRIPYFKAIDATCVLKIEGNYYKVYNIYHFVDNNGFNLSDITLTNWE
jgi:SPP1 family predicted phage head-tail adaptor